MINCYDQRPLTELKAELGWANQVDISYLVAMIMILCDHVIELEHKIANQEIEKD